MWWSAFPLTQCISSTGYRDQLIELFCIHKKNGIAGVTREHFAGRRAMVGSMGLVSALGETSLEITASLGPAPFCVKWGPNHWVLVKRGWNEMPKVPGSKQELNQYDETSTFLFTASARRQKVKQQASY